jgi:ABC-type proline/glycine betaine transport system permease subunit
VETDQTTFPDPSRQMADAVSSLARTLERLETNQHALPQVLQRLTSTLRVGYGCLALAALLTLAGLGFLIVQGYNLHEQTRVVVQTNQALLTELLQRTPR